MTVKHLNQAELADRWDLSQQTLERWRAIGWGPCFLMSASSAGSIKVFLAWRWGRRGRTLRFDKLCSKQSLDAQPAGRSAPAPTLADVPCEPAEIAYRLGRPGLKVYPGTAQPIAQ